MTHLRSLAPFVAAVTLFGGAALAQQQPVALVSLPQGTINYFQTAAIAKVVQQNSDLIMRVKTMRGAPMGLAAVAEGDAEFQLGNIIEATDALNGTGDYKGAPLKTLRVVANNRPLGLGIFVRKDSPIKTIADLKGKRFPTGWKAYPSVVTNITAILKTGGLTFDDVNPVPVPELIRATEDFKQGKTDAGYFAVDGPKVREIDAAVGAIRFLSLPNTKEAQEAVRSVKPDLFIMPVKPGPNLPGVIGTTNVLAFDLVITTSTKVPDAVVRSFVKALHDNREALIKAHPSFRQFDPKQMAKPFRAMKYHPAALKYYEEIGLSSKTM
jgi:TRAP transporter TAXI family solute receptor